MKEDREARAREAVRRARRNVTWLRSKKENRRVFRAAMEVKPVEWLVAAAREGDKDALDILRDHARGARRAGMNVPDEFHAFVWECFIDGQPKAKPGASPKDSWATYSTIAVLMRMVNRDYGFPLHSGDVTAIGIVADELGLSEDRAIEIWEDWGNLTSPEPFPRNSTA